MDSKEVDEVTRRIAVLVGAVRSDVRTVAEGLMGVSASLAELRADVQKLERKVESESVETRAMIKLSYTELDRRLGALENGYSELRERIERLESTRGN